MTKGELLEYLKKNKKGVLATIDGAGKPEAALIGFAVTDGLELIFDTASSTRKYRNLQQNLRVALVAGWDDMTTLQYEGVATELDDSAESARYREIYYAAFPDGRERTATWPGIVHFRISPEWIRYSDFNDQHTIEEFSFPG